jgi:hypothetical protein
MPVPDLARPQPKPEPAVQTTRPLTPAFKPSHSASAPEKVTDLTPNPEPKPPRTDPWAMRAELTPATPR